MERINIRIDGNTALLCSDITDVDIDFNFVSVSFRFFHQTVDWLDLHGSTSNSAGGSGMTISDPLAFKDALTKSKS